MSYASNNTSAANRQLTNELRFAYRVRQALNESADTLPSTRLEQLAAARKAALRAHNQGKPLAQWVTRPAFVGSGEMTLAGGFGGMNSQASGSGNRNRAGFALLLLVLLTGIIVGLYQTEQQRHAEELADIDAAVLDDELPISAYADHGFNAYLKQNQ